jgi:sugar phosphate isomerase/epimerase
MKLAICNETFVDWPLGRALDFAANCGYSGVEFAPFTLGPSAPEITAAERVEIRRAAERSGLEVLGLHWLLAKTQGLHLTSPDSAVRQRTAEYLAELARLSRDLGGSLLVLGSPQQRNRAPGVTPADGMAYAAEVIRAALPSLERTEVTLGVEPLGPADGNFLLTAAEGESLIAAIDSPLVRLHLDCRAMATESVPIPELIHRHRRHLVHFHANDPNRQGPGMGTLDFVPILKALDENDYRGFVSVEVFDYSPGPEALASKSAEYLKACWKQVQREREISAPTVAEEGPSGH